VISSGWHAWPRTLLLAAARFVVALAVYAAAQLLSRVLFGDQDRMPLGVVLVASALLATVFYLVDRRLEMLADRLVLGDRAGGYEAVRALVARMASTLPVDEVVPALAETAGRTVHSSRAEVRLLLSDGDAWSQVWPPRAAPDGAEPIEPDAVPVTVGVRHAGAAVGEIEVDVTEPGESDRDRRLLHDLARPAGLALSTVRLTIQLRRRADELEKLTAELELSNQRIIDARHSELARLGGEMADRVLPHIDRARSALGGPGADEPAGPEPAGPQSSGLAAAAAEVAGALDALRTLARGIYPPRLADAGLGVSLEGWQQRSGVPVDLRILGDQAVLHRQEELEACLYFCLVTALGSLAADGQRPAAVVDIGPADVAVQVTGTVASTTYTHAVQAVRDRIEAFGGTMENGIDTRIRPGGRAVVGARVPLQRLASARTLLGVGDQHAGERSGDRR